MTARPNEGTDETKQESTGTSEPIGRTKAATLRTSEEAAPTSEGRHEAPKHFAELHTINIPDVDSCLGRAESGVGAGMYF